MSMCGRYEILNGERIFVRFGVANATSTTQTQAQTQASEIFANLEVRDVRPTQQVPALLTDHQLQVMKWGLVPSWAKDAAIGNKMINARAEGIAEKPSFKRPLRTQRCLLPASAFFEWQGIHGIKSSKTKYRIGRKDGDMFGLAGLYDTWKRPGGDELMTCTIITCAPNAVMAPIHTRMPVILLPEDEDAWLDPDMTEVERITRYLRPYPDVLLEAVRAA
jgi:putative SOS response-associated peptidase YedK